MASTILDHGSVSKIGIFDVQTCLSLLENNQINIESNINRLRKEIRSIHYRIKEATKDYRDFLLRVNPDATPAILQNLTNDDVIPNPNETKSFLTYIDHDEARKKIFIAPSYAQLRESTIKISGKIEGELTYHEALLIVLYGAKIRLQYDLSSLYAHLSNICGKKTANLSDYNNLKALLNRLIYLQCARTSIEDLFTDFPKTTTAHDTLKRASTYMSTYTVLYKTRTRNLMKQLTTLADDFPSESTIIKGTVNLLMKDEIFMGQFLGALENEEHVLGLLSGLGEILSSLRAEAVSGMKALTGQDGIADNEINDQVTKATQFMMSNVSANTVQDQTAAQRNSINNENFVKASNFVDDMLNNASTYVTKFISDLKSKPLGSVKAATSDFLSKSKVMQFFAEVSGTPMNNTLSPSENLEDYWRRTIRARYGGDAPFEDEVTIKVGSNKDADINAYQKKKLCVFIKIDENTGKMAVASEDDPKGVWMLKTEYEKEQLRVGMQSSSIR